MSDVTDQHPTAGQVLAGTPPNTSSMPLYSRARQPPTARATAASACATRSSQILDLQHRAFPNAQSRGALCLSELPT